MGAMANVSVVMLMFFVIFGILAVQVFAGQFYRCTDPGVSTMEQCVGSYYDAATGDVAERRWNNAYLNFDNLYRALISLFVISTLDGYGQLMFDSLDTVGRARAGHPIRFRFFVQLKAGCLTALHTRGVYGYVYIMYTVTSVSCTRLRIVR